MIVVQVLTQLVVEHCRFLGMETWAFRWAFSGLLCVWVEEAVETEGPG